MSRVRGVEALATPGTRILDNAVWAALTGPHAHFAERVGQAAKGIERVPDGWATVGAGQGVQLVDTALRSEAAPEAVRLGPGDVSEILELVARTRPGPFLTRTVQLGTYLGIRHRGRLIAMAGERLRPAGWTEISAVCTDPAHRGKGLATRLVRAVAAGIRERGETPFLHAAATNTRAIRMYESIGFTPRCRTTILRLRTPGTDRAAGPL
jgi:ribosomal protein S18 acetylase RimI-like enzyme